MKRYRLIMLCSLLFTVSVALFALWQTYLARNEHERATAEAKAQAEAAAVAAEQERLETQNISTAAVMWNPDIAKEEEAARNEANIISYDQRSIDIARFMDDVNYKIYTNSSAVNTYKTDFSQANSHPVGYQVTTQPGQSIVITNETDPTQTIAPITATSTSYTIYNLIPYNTYKVEIQNDDQTVVDSYRIRPTGSVRFIYFRYVPNFRDLGGWETEDGKTVRYGMIFRGGEILNTSNLEDLQRDLDSMAALGIKLEVDLRSNGEAGYTHSWQVRNKKEGWSQIDGAKYVRYEIRGSKSAIDLRTNFYGRTLFALHDIIDSVNAGEPVYFHCSAGADRAGIIATMLEGLLGVSEPDMDKDYELTSFAYQKTLRYRTYEGYTEIKNYIKSQFPGDTLQAKFYNWFVRAGFTTDDLDRFIDNMIL